MTVQWEVIEPEPTFVGPPKPIACVDGWASHRWTLHVDEGMCGLTTDDCRLCNDGVAELEHEYYAGALPVRIEMLVERSYWGEADAYLSITPDPRS